MKKCNVLTCNWNIFLYNTERKPEDVIDYVQFGFHYTKFANLDRYSWQISITFAYKYILKQNDPTISGD